MRPVSENTVEVMMNHYDDKGKGRILIIDYVILVIDAQQKVSYYVSL